MIKLCSIEGCDREAKLKGMCQRHYQRGYEQRKRDLRMKTPEKPVPPMVPAPFPPYAEGLRYFLHNYGVTKEAFAAKIRICEFHRAHPEMTKRKLAEILGFGYQTVCEWARTDYGSFPSTQRLPMLHAALDAYEQEHGPSVVPSPHGPHSTNL